MLHYRKVLDEFYGSLKIAKKSGDKYIFNPEFYFEIDNQQIFSLQLIPNYYFLGNWRNFLNAMENNQNIRNVVFGAD